MNPSFVSDEVADAPMAIPSAAAWIMRPVVVARLLLCLGVGVSDWRKDSDSSFPASVGEECRPCDRLSSEMCLVGGIGLSEAWRGSLSMRNMRINPVTNENPM